MRGPAGGWDWSGCPHSRGESARRRSAWGLLYRAPRGRGMTGRVVGIQMLSSLAVKSQEVVCRKVVHPGSVKRIWGCQATRSLRKEPRMNIHQNARLTPQGRAEVVRQVRAGASARAVARAAHVCEKTVRKWVARAAAGEPLTDRSSRPHPQPQTLPAP